MPDKRPEYHYTVAVTSHWRGPVKSWTWEILRTPELGVRLYGENFSSEQAAKLAGEKALHAFLLNVAKEAEASDS
jgi:hypothetical protein